MVTAKKHFGELMIMIIKVMTAKKKEKKLGLKKWRERGRGR